MTTRKGLGYPPLVHLESQRTNGSSVEYVEYVVDLLYILVLIVYTLQLVESHWSRLVVIRAW